MVPVSRELPPVEEEYQLIVPDEDVAPRSTLPSPQREAAVVLVIVGTSFTVTCTLSVTVQLLSSSTVTVYVVVSVGETVGLATSEGFVPTEALQVYPSVPVPPLPVGLPPISTDSPSHIEVLLPALAINSEGSSTV